ncbi:hypothetical protein VII00023_02049 [Vibrio ichthyoenteri ATCC 700023]|uniref:DUF2726 domain-containing protein n=1 Tax=Vibrio ichthyoenteri ATCC 700023 TaxID=870968 RepID=F9RY19_9VIBR|nr:DUF2726 domain-containing protein [Vibrio ichthyoenteri]EGU47019.1 hypothetical protein VII00023_02049 [Vibrio ichthyoenteri ATCC 700023]
MDLNVVAIAVGVIFFLVLIGRLSRRTNGKPNQSATTTDYLYQSRNTLVTKSELAFYRALTVSVKNRHLIFSKVRIADVLSPKKGEYDKSNWRRAFNQIACKHYDFVLCDPETLDIHMVIELDDSSHERNDRKKRDVFVDAATASAGVTFKRFKVQKTYDYFELENELYGTASAETAKSERALA